MKSKSRFKRIIKCRTGNYKVVSRSGGDGRASSVSMSGASGWRAMSYCGYWSYSSSTVL